MAGQIVSRGPKKWLVRVYLGRDGAGKRRYHNKTIHGTKKDAERYKTKVMRDRDTGELVELSRKPLGEYLSEWLESVAKPRVKARTLQSYREMANLYLLPALGHHRLGSITPMDIQACYSGMLDRGLSARTVRYAHAVLRSALDQAVKWNLLSRNPATLVSLPRMVRAESRALSPKEAQAFLAAAQEDRWHALWVVLVATGLRPGEAMGLKWPDLVNNRLHIQRVLVPGSKGTWRFADPKTARSRRSVTLPEIATQALRQHRVDQAREKLAAGGSYHDNGLVFAGVTGEPVDMRSLTRNHFHRILEKAGLPKIRLYDLRHTSATLLLAAGEHPKIVSERLGHSSVMLTLDTYSHVLPDMQARAAEKMDLLLG